MRCVAISGAVLAASALAWLGCDRQREPAPSEPPVPAATTAPLSPSAKLEEDMELMATGTPGSATGPNASLAAAGRFEELVDHLLADPRFALTIAPRVVLHSANLSVVGDLHGYPLSTFHASRGDAYYLYRPCSEDDLVEVSPWWKMSTPVLVCRDSYRPEVTGDAKKGYRCGSRMLAPRGGSSVCGCGPDLVYCARDESHAKEIEQSLLAEETNTVADVVSRDLPLAQVFLANETVRDMTAEFQYRRWRIASGQAPAAALSDLATWPKGAAIRASRPESFPGQHAGILTVPNVAFGEDAPRGIMNDRYNLLWCSPGSSTRVTTSAVLHLGVADVRQGDGWKKLAGMPICTDCHARLDYGRQFFSGFSSPFHTVDFLPSEHVRGRGPLYGDSIDDRLGVADLTPQGFASLAVASPRFEACMIDDVAGYVFEESRSPEDDRALREAWARSPTMKSLMRAALLRFAQRAGEHVDAPAVLSQAASDAGAPGDELAVAPILQHDLSTFCVDCHDDHRDDGAPSFDRPTLPRSLVSTMLESVAFRQMPKSSRLAEADRRRLIDELLVAADYGPASRAYFADALRAARVHSTQAAFALVNRATGARESAPNLLRQLASGPSSFTPAFATIVSLDALQQCKAMGRSGAALESCVEQGTRPEAFIVGAVP